MTAHIYSGRVNPQWVISPEEFAKLLAAIENLSQQEPVPQKSMLGYSGISIIAGTKKIFLFDGVITVEEEKRIKGYTDSKRRLEKQLLQTAPLAIAYEIRTALPAELTTHD